MPRTTKAPQKRRMVAEESEGDEQSEEEPARSTQRQRRHGPAGEDSDEESDLENGGPIAREELETGDENSEDQFIKKLVRYALACEYARLPIRREGIKDKVFGKHKVSFKQVFDAAQEQLRTKFGMEMIELPLKEKVTDKERRAALKMTNPLASSKSYILTSILPIKYRSPTILPPSTVPTASTEAEYTALYTMIISLISLFGSDGRLSDAKLDQYLRRMNADVNMPMDKTENALQKMIKQGYIVKIKENCGNDEIIDWMVGPRGKIEVGKNGVKGLVEEVYREDAPEDLAERIKSSLGLDTGRGEQEEEAAASVENTQEANRRPRRSGRHRDEEDD